MSRIQATHILGMVREAEELIENMDGRDSTGTVEIPGSGVQTAFTVLERIENLLTHAAAEIKDEQMLTMGFRRV